MQGSSTGRPTLPGEGPGCPLGSSKGGLALFQTSSSFMAAGPLPDRHLDRAPESGQDAIVLTDSEAKPRN
eukprot:4395500-Lingulodinium_polyedra.AAC.2